MNYGMGPNFGFGPANFSAPGFVPASYFPMMNWGGGYGYTPPPGAWMGPSPMGWGQAWGPGGMPTWGGTYAPPFGTTGLPSDTEIVAMVYDAMDDDPSIPFDANIIVDSDAGTVTLTGTVFSKLVKHAAGDDAWWIPGVDDVRNQLQVVAPQRRLPGGTTRGEKREERPAATPRATRAGATTGGTTTGTGTTRRAATPTTGRQATTAKATTGTTGRAGTQSASGTRGRSGSAK